MNLDKAIKKRRSVRQYKRERIPRRTINKILDAGRWAPSVHNMQPWQFIVVEGKFKDKLVKAMKVRRKREILFIRVILKSAITIIESAPALILAYRTKAFSQKIQVHKLGLIEGNRRNVWQRTIDLWGTQSVSCAVENMLLTAYSLGIGAVWLGILLFRDRAINKMIKADGKLMAVVALGYPVKPPSKATRVPLSKITSFRS